MSDPTQLQNLAGQLYAALSRVQDRRLNIARGAYTEWDLEDENKLVEAALDAAQSAGLEAPPTCNCLHWPDAKGLCGACGGHLNSYTPRHSQTCPADLQEPTATQIAL